MPYARIICRAGVDREVDPLACSFHLFLNVRKFWSTLGKALILGIRSSQARSCGKPVSSLDLYISITIPTPLN